MVPVLETSVVFAIVASISELYVLGGILFAPKMRRLFSCKLLFFIAINGFSMGVAYTLTTDSLEGDEHGLRCQVQAFMLNYFPLATYFWHCAIAHTLSQAFDHAINVRHEALGWNTLAKYIVVCQLFPIIPSGLPFNFNAYGYAKLFCWVSQTGRSEGLKELLDGSIGGESLKRLYLEFFCFFIWGWFAMVYIIYCYYRIRQNFALLNRQLQQLHNDDLIQNPHDAEGEHDSRSSRTMRTWKTLRFYPSFLLACLVGSSIYRPIQVFTDVTPSWIEVALLLANICQPLADAMIFAANPVMRRMLRERLRQLIYKGRNGRDGGGGGGHAGSLQYKQVERTGSPLANTCDPVSPREVPKDFSSSSSQNRYKISSARQDRRGVVCAGTTVSLRAENVLRSDDDIVESRFIISPRTAMLQPFSDPTGSQALLSNALISSQVRNSRSVSVWREPPTMSTDFGLHYDDNKGTSSVGKQ
eukprot:jgi/Bigna1/146216/aug1.110_g20924